MSCDASLHAPPKSHEMKANNLSSVELHLDEVFKNAIFLYHTFWSWVKTICITFLKRQTFLVVTRKLKNVFYLRKVLSSLRCFSSFSRSGILASSDLTVFTMATSCSCSARHLSSSCQTMTKEISKSTTMCLLCGLQTSSVLSRYFWGWN